MFKCNISSNLCINQKLAKSLRLGLLYTEQYFSVVLLTRQFKLEKICVKAIEQYFPVVLFIMLYKVVLTFEFADVVVQFLFWFEIFKPV